MRRAAHFNTYAYEVPIEGQRHRIQMYRQMVLVGETPCASDFERLITLRTIDDLWSDYLTRVADFRSGVHWLSWGRWDPHYEYLQKGHEWISELETALPGEISKWLAEAEASGENPGERGAVWTYVTTDQPFGSWTERVIRVWG